MFATAEQTGSVWGVWGYTAAPKFGPPLHIHREEDEFFYVLGGEFAFQLRDCVKMAPTGSFVFIPKGAEHTFRNVSDTPGKLLGGVTPGDFEDAFARLTREPPDALFLVAEVLTIRNRCRVLKFAERNRLPAIYEFGLFARDGGLMAYGPKLTESIERGAYYVDKILKGMKPTDLPVEQPKSFELRVNVTTAEALGLVISPSILMQADATEVGGVNQCARMW